MLTQMCSNRAIVDSLECCMDDLVECFEDFVKKSLILIFLGIGVIVGLLCYLLKIVLERPSLSSGSQAVENTTHKQNEINEVIENNKKVEEEVLSNRLKEIEEKKIDKKDDVKNIKDKNNKTDKVNNVNDVVDTDADKDQTTTAANTSNLPILPSFDENVLRDVGLSSCSKYGCGVGSHIYTPSRVPVPNIPTSSSKQTFIPCIRKRSLNKSNIPSLQICPRVTKPGSCCSMCCYDEKRSEDLDRQTIYRNHQ